MNDSRTLRFWLGGGLVFCLAIAATVQTQAIQSQAETVSSEATRDRVASEAIKYLMDTGQADDGSFSSFAGPAITSLVTSAMLKNDVPVSNPSVARALKYLTGYVQPDGGIYNPESVYKNYETSLAVMCLTEANASGSYTLLIENAVRFLKGTQWDMNRDVDESDSRFGGFGYGKHGRPDLSNTSYTIDALISAGEGADSEAIQRALKFVSRSQNHESDHNTLPHAAKNPDGGFYYTPSGDGESKADRTDNGGLRSYGSMTYAGLKSMLYAGVDKDDTRVKAASDWIRMNYGLENNPGMGAQGLFYYYHVFAKALDASGEDQVEDADGVRHDWRKELIAELARRQIEDGSWTNQESDRWMEGDPNLVSGYALLALSYCKGSDNNADSNNDAGRKE